MKIAGIRLALPYLVRLGWLSTRTPNPPLSEAVGRAYLLRGDCVIFSRGLGTLCGQLRRAGWWAEDLRCMGDGWACRHLIADHSAGRLRGPVVFVGHSCGGRYSLVAAHRLWEAGIIVDLIVCLDVAWPSDVPGNVRHAMNLYLGGRRIYPAQPLRSAADSTGPIENIDLTAADSPISAHWLNHLNITDRPALQDFVLQRVLATVQAAQPGPGASLPAKL